MPLTCIFKNQNYYKEFTINRVHILLRNTKI